MSNVWVSSKRLRIDVLIWSALLLSASLSAPQAFARESCPGAAKDRYWVKVRSETPPPKVNRSLSRVELGLMATHHLTDRILGLYTTGPKIEWAAGYGTTPYGDAYCFWVKGVDVVLRYETPDVYVAKEYPPGSCNYKAILTHEMRHVKVAQEYFKRYVPRIRSVLTSLLIPKPKSAVLVDSPEQAKREATELLKKLLGSVFNELGRAFEDAQGGVDSPQEYRKVQRRCKKW